MRVTNGMMTNNLLKNLSDNMERLDKFNRQLSTGKKFDMPSQDPTGVVTSMGLKSTLNSNEQYIDNIDQALTWTSTTENALKNATKTLQRTRELAVYGANDSLSDSDRNAIADEVEQLREGLTEVANTDYNGRYIFAGYKTTTEPYPTADSNYQGDNGAIDREITRGVEMKINQDGAFFKGVFDEMKDLVTDLRNGNGDAISNTRIGNLDKKLNKVLRLRSEIGAKQNRLELTKSRLDEDKIKFKKLLSKNEDVDIAETIMNLKMSENVHRAALSSGARIIQPSLMQFLK
ncbi:flagellar hook-associated protein FlgL [Selenihalanaerobacter shriftii]|uniref:Flagellar hook-associated protein 3 FlgL n=1 Tax=Selenihalanaerobacter shriftii TaxID=142842 RepID=A0A1T4KPA9_9FIRM|nr:flagellar hook-associated protein FlgL [Selenihalanaerobacter shriftii]SJZ44252.1 flagellar hook-associated protein 3 FlgL [Selenihalanaerobacter shriftii]